MILKGTLLGICLLLRHNGNKMVTWQNACSHLEKRASELNN
jgi:hypothetical protein